MFRIISLVLSLFLCLEQVESPFSFERGNLNYLAPRSPLGDTGFVFPDRQERPITLYKNQNTISSPVGYSGQDSAFAGELDNGIQIAAVLDGHGKKGKEVSRSVKETLLIELKKLDLHASDREVVHILSHALIIANEKVSELIDEVDDRSLSLRQKGGTTATVVVVLPSKSSARVFVANQGDSRAYLAYPNYYNTGLQPLTVDNLKVPEGHVLNMSEVQEELEKSQLILAEIASEEDFNREAKEGDWGVSVSFDERYAVENVLDGSEGFRPVITALEVKPGSTILLTSDGVHDVLTHSQMTWSSARALVGSANRSQEDPDNYRRKGSHDDATAVRFEVKPGNAPARVSWGSIIKGDLEENWTEMWYLSRTWRQRLEDVRYEKRMRREEREREYAREKEEEKEKEELTRRRARNTTIVFAIVTAIIGLGYYFVYKSRMAYAENLTSTKKLTDEDIEFLVENSDSWHKELRRSAVRAMGDIGFKPLFVEPLIRLLQDKELYIREDAARTLNIFGRSFLDYLTKKEILKQKDEKKELYLKSPEAVKVMRLFIPEILKENPHLMIYFDTPQGEVIGKEKMELERKVLIKWFKEKMTDPASKEEALKGLIDLGVESFSPAQTEEKPKKSKETSQLDTPRPPFAYEISI